MGSFCLTQQPVLRIADELRWKNEKYRVHIASALESCLKKLGLEGFFNGLSFFVASLFQLGEYVALLASSKSKVILIGQSLNYLIALHFFKMSISQLISISTCEHVIRPCTDVRFRRSFLTSPNK